MHSVDCARGGNKAITAHLGLCGGRPLPLSTSRANCQLRISPSISSNVSWKGGSGRGGGARARASLLATAGLPTLSTGLITCTGQRTTQINKQTRHKHSANTTHVNKQIKSSLLVIYHHQHSALRMVGQLIDDKGNDESDCTLLMMAN